MKFRFKSKISQRNNFIPYRVDIAVAVWYDRVDSSKGGQDTFGCVEKERVDVAELFLQASAETLHDVIGPLDGLNRRWIYVA